MHAYKFKWLYSYLLQAKLKEAHRKEQELNNKLRQYCNDLEAAKVYSTVTLYMSHTNVCDS